jgi:NAD(P)-dependent dehydrogenase (short-subunit alcohol dehydrogenase family)
VDLTGKVVLVTGASSGIGASTATSLHEAGALADAPVDGLSFHHRPIDAVHGGCGQVSDSLRM